MAPKSEQEKRAASWQRMREYALQIAREHLPRRKIEPLEEEQEPTRITRNIGPVHSRKFKKVAA